MKIQHSSYFILIAMSFLAGCSPPIATPPTTWPTLSMSVPAPTSSPTKEAILITTTPPPENILKFRPFETLPELLSDVKPGGILVIWNESLQKLYFDPQIRLEVIPDIEFDGCLSTSPDGKWLAHCPLSEDSPTGQWLIVQSADQQQEKKMPLDTRLRYFGDYLWLDNQQLIFPLIREEHHVAYPMVVLNPFTGQQTQLDSDYPDLRLSVAGPASRMDFNFSDVVYDPSLDLVVYPSWGGEHNYIILWDRQTQSVVARVDDASGSFGYYPLWSPDATRLAIPVVAQQYKTNDTWTHVDEWIIVNRTGQVERLTRFGDFFTNAFISGFAKWSPDGEKLAFWLEVTPSLCSGLRLAILELKIKQVTNTCISGQSEYAVPPIWSLDSRYIIAINSQQVILLDVEKETSFDITEYGLPIGWLALP